MTHPSKTTTQPNSRFTVQQTARWLADLYCLWRFCGTQACRRSRACKGDVRACFCALPLVPPEALAFLQGFDEGQRDFLSFDEMMARNEDEWAAVEEWQELVLSTLAESEERSPPR